MTFPQTDLTFGLFDVATGDQLAAPLRQLFVFAQNNVTPTQDVTGGDTDPTTWVWPATTVSSTARYVGTKLRDRSAPDVNLNPQPQNLTAVAVDPTMIAVSNNNGYNFQFTTLKAGTSVINMSYPHPDDPTVTVLSTLRVTAA